MNIHRKVLDPSLQFSLVFRISSTLFCVGNIIESFTECGTFIDMELHLAPNMFSTTSLPKSHIGKEEK